MADVKWYVVHTYSGYENKVKANIEKTVENRHIEEQIPEVAVPLEDVVETKNGVQRTVQRKRFPGYVFVNMDMNDETWYVVRNTRGVTGFVGPGSKPVPLSYDEIVSLGLAGDAEVPQNQTPRYATSYEVGDMIIVTKGAWEGTEGAVKEVNAPRQTVTISVDLFGRETPVELNFSEIRKK